MSSEKKKRKVSKRRHPMRRDGGWLKEKGSGTGMKRLSFYTSAQRKQDKKNKI